MRLKLHWVPFDVQNKTLKKALKDFGTVRKITRDQSRVVGFEGIKSTTKVVLLLKDGTILERFSHQLWVFGSAVLAVIPGRALLLLRCQRHVQIRRHCRAPRCAVTSIRIVFDPTSMPSEVEVMKRTQTTS